MALFLGRRGLLTGGLGSRMRDEVREEIRQAVEQAEAFAAKPPIDSLFEDVYAEPLWQQRRQREELRAEAVRGPDLEA